MKPLDANLVSETPEGWALIAQKCRDCGNLAFPRKRVCPECFGDDLADQPLSHNGTLHTYARTFLGVPRLGSPYVIGFVDLPEKIRLFGLLDVSEETVLEAGQKMDIVIARLWQDDSGEDVFSYKFQPAAAES